MSTPSRDPESENQREHDSRAANQPKSEDFPSSPSQDDTETPGAAEPQQ